MIIFPLCKPILATIAVFSALGHWNSFIDSLILMGGRPELQTLQHKLYNYLQKTSNLKALMDSGRAITAEMVKQTLNERSIKFTVAMVSIIPILCVYPFLQKYFQRGIMIGAVKG
jgi:putative aldouronate transport system permease protein